MPWITTPTLAQTPDGRLIVHKRGATRSDWYEYGWSIPGFAILSLSLGWPAITPATTPPDRTAAILGAAFFLVIGTATAFWFRHQTRPRTTTLDPEGLTVQNHSGPAQRLAWSDVRSVHWSTSSIQLEGSQPPRVFQRGDYSPADWSILSDWLVRALRPRFDLPAEPPTISFGWTRVLVASLPPAVVLGGLIPLAKHLSPIQITWSVLGAVLGIFLDIIILALRCRGSDEPPVRFQHYPRGKPRPTP